MDGRELARMFNLNHRATTLNLEGVDEEVALEAPRPAGNCINWILGHIVAYRDGALRAIGADPVWDDDDDVAAAYRGDPGTEWEAERALPLERLHADLDRSQERLVAALEGMSAEDVAAFTGTASLTFMHFHEAYHIGQLGLGRRLAGLPGAIKPPAS